MIGSVIGHRRTAVVVYRRSTLSVGRGKIKIVLYGASVSFGFQCGIVFQRCGGVGKNTVTLSVSRVSCACDTGIIAELILPLLQHMPMLSP